MDLSGIELTVVIPAYNEQENLPVTVEELVNRLSPLIGGLELVIVDDGSTDSTLEAAKRLSFPGVGIQIISHEANRGLGSAIWTGLSAATKKWCTWTPADGQIGPDAIGKLAEAAGPGVVALLFREEEAREAHRRLLTRIFFVLTRLLLPHGAFAFSGIFAGERDILTSIPAVCSSGLQNLLVAFYCSQKGIPTAAVRTAPLARLSGVSKVNTLRGHFRLLREMLALRFYLARHPLR